MRLIQPYRPGKLDQSGAEFGKVASISGLRRRFSVVISNWLASAAGCGASRVRGARSEALLYCAVIAFSGMCGVDKTDYVRASDDVFLRVNWAVGLDNRTVYFEIKMAELVWAVEVGKTFFSGLQRQHPWSGKSSQHSSNL